jgi:hypothetical protein
MQRKRKEQTGPIDFAVVEAAIKTYINSKTDVKTNALMKAVKVVVPWGTL